MHLNVQIVPFPSDRLSLRPEWAKIVQVPARQGQGEEGGCMHCGGTGVYGRHEEPCGKCGGTGRGWFALALRAEPTNESQTNQLIEVLDELGHQIEKGDIGGVKVQRTIHLRETGGGLTNTGSAQIICGLHGEPLVGFGGHARCGAVHAHFYVHAAMVIKYGQHRGSGSGTVTFVGVDRAVRHNLGIDTAPLWRFEDGSDVAREILSERALEFAFPVEAAKAARDKARSYHCRSAYYCASGGANGPSGALTGGGAAFGGMPSPLKGPGIGYAP